MWYSILIEYALGLSVLSVISTYAITAKQPVINLIILILLSTITLIVHKGATQLAKRIFTSANITYTASAAGSATAGSSATFMALKGGSATQTTDVLEILVSGKATSSTVAAMNFARASTLETTPTALAAPHSDGPLHPATAALGAPVVTFVAASTGPTPSNTVTDAHLNLALNLFGGIIRWNAAPTQQWTIVTATAPLGESLLWNSSTAGGSTGLADAHIIYETY
jgi:hypothetical protein